MSGNLKRQIHVACRQLGIDGDARHDLQLVVCGKSSMKDMDEADLNKVLDSLKSKGFKAGFNGGVKQGFKAPAERADLRLIHVLWKKLEDAGELVDPTRRGLNAFIRSQFGAAWASVPADVDMLRDPKQIEAVIRALKEWGKRAGIDFDWDRK